MTARVKASTVMRTFEERVILKARQEQTVVLELQARNHYTYSAAKGTTCCTHGTMTSSIAPLTRHQASTPGLPSREMKTDRGYLVGVWCATRRWS